MRTRSVHARDTSPWTAPDPVGLRGRDIICFSSHYWDDRWFRKQEFMSRFARENRVLFVEPSFSMVRRSEPYLRELSENRYLVARTEARSGGIHLLKPPRGIPKWSRPAAEAVNYRWYGRGIARAARRLRFRDPILWVYQPAYVHALPEIPRAHLVFDLCDDWSAYYEGSARADHMESVITSLVASSELVVASAQTLIDRYAPRSEQAVAIPNGFDADVFSPRGNSNAVPPTLAHLPRPLLGFVGTLFNFLDFELLDAVAHQHADKSIVLVGPTEAGAQEAVDRLSKRPNVFLLGRQPQPVIPDYVRSFDVCLNPFRMSRASDSVSPLKVFEYLAMGRPVVSTRMKALEMEPAAQYVAFAGDADHFCRQIDHCLTGPVQEAVEQRRSGVAEYSWERLFGRLDAVCETTLDR